MRPPGWRPEPEERVRFFFMGEHRHGVVLRIGDDGKATIEAKGATMRIPLDDIEPTMRPWPGWST